MAQFDRMKDDGFPHPKLASTKQTGHKRRYVQGVRDELEAGTGLWLRRKERKN